MESSLSSRGLLEVELRRAKRVRARLVQKYGVIRGAKYGIIWVKYGVCHTGSNVVLYRQ